MRRIAVVLASVMATASTVSPRGSAPLAGTWRLVSFESRDEAGTATHQMGPDAIGQLMYDAAGNMSVHLMQPERTRFASGDRLEGTDKEVRMAFEGYHAYFGRYSVDTDAHTVTHRVMGSSFPNLVGSAQVRVFALEGDRLTLSTPPIRAGGRSITSVLVWERVTSDAKPAR